MKLRNRDVPYLALFAVHVGLSASMLSEISALERERDALRAQAAEHDQVLDHAYHVCDGVSQMHQDETDQCLEALHQAGEGWRACRVELADRVLWNEATEKLLSDDDARDEMNASELYHQCHWDLGHCEVDLHDALEDLSRRGNPHLWEGAD